MTAAVHVHLRCRFCGKGRLAGDFIGPWPLYPCNDCHAWHLVALQILAGGAPPGCQECRRSGEQIAAEEPEAKARMYLHPKDGLYQVLCRACSDHYIAVRADLYRPTPFGHEQKV